MMTIKAGMRTLSGITLRRAEMAMLLPSSTKVAAAPMPRPLMALVVTASVGQVPSTRRKVGFSVSTPFIKMRPRPRFSLLMVYLASFRALRQP